MINYRETAGRWLEQAAADLAEAESALDRDRFSYACFLAEQSAQKSLKGYLISQKEINLGMHSIAALASKAAEFKRELADFIAESKVLDKYYLSTRYPDALPEPLVPAGAYTQSEAEAAVAIARKILNQCQIDPMK